MHMSAAFFVWPETRFPEAGGFGCLGPCVRKRPLLDYAAFKRRSRWPILCAARRFPGGAAGEWDKDMKPVFLTVALLLISNTFMTFAWYAHLKNLADKPWLVAALASWGVALMEYLFQVPANRIGYTALTLAQLKIIQEVITLSVFVPFAMLYMRQSWSWNYLWAALCLLGAVFFMFRR